MDCLLDTQVVIWSLDDDPRLPPKVREVIEDTQHSVSITIVNLWEIVIKRSLNKLAFSMSLHDIRTQVVSKRVTILPITIDHLEAVETPAYQGKHRDPFDRLIISQAIAEDLVLISSDPHFKNYPVKLFW